MNRNTESHFAQLPRADVQRSRFDRSSGHKFSGNCGDLIPFYLDEVLPGDTFNVQTSIVARLQTLLTPIMDNVYMDTYYFFVPNRLLYKYWREVMGENTESAWYPATSYSVPQIESPEGGWNVGTIADYLGIPPGVEFTEDSGLTVSALPFRAYAMICDQFFRDQNVSDPLLIPLGDDLQTGSNGDSYVTDVANGGKPFKAAKYHDMFTSCLPSPQKGPPVTVANVPSPVGNLVSVLPSDEYFTMPKKLVPMVFDGLVADLPYSDSPSYGNSYRLVEPGVYPFGTDAYYNGGADVNKSYSVLNNDHSGTYYGNAVFRREVQGIEGESYHYSPAATWYDGAGSSGQTGSMPINLFFDPSDIAFQPVGFNINELRLAFQLQKFYEKNARGGTRYRELLKMHFGVTSPDARMQIPEYLGGHRFPLSIHQITNQSQGENDFLGDLGAMSNTADVHSDFIKSFTEHGLVMGLCVVRYDHSYPQGLDRMWTRKDSTDFYWPVFANIGEQPVYKYEIDASVREGEDRNAVFGYNEAWCQYRFKPSRVSGELRPGVANSLAHWHLADYYTEQPALSDAWIREDLTNVDRVLAVTSSVSNQFFADFWIQNIATRPMPVYSIPGLIDHH